MGAFLQNVLYSRIPGALRSFGLAQEVLKEIGAEDGTLRTAFSRGLWPSDGQRLAREALGGIDPQ